VLPSDARGSILQNIDAQFAGIFVLVAPLQISLVTYARSLPYIEPSSIEQVGERYQKIIMPDRIPEPPKDTQADQNAGKDKAKEKEKGKDEGKKGTAKKGPAKKTDQDQEAAARARKEAITKAVAGKGLLRVLGAKGKGEGAINDVFSEGGAVGNLGDAFSGIQGVDVAGSGGERGTRGGGSGEGVGIGNLQTEGGGNVKTGGKGAEAAVAGSLKTEAPEVDGKLSQSEITGVMKRQIKALRDCYESALKRNRQLSGKLVIRFEIDDAGRTQNIEFEEDSLGSPDVKECISRRAKYWRFPKPEGGSRFVAYPIVFTPAA
jgi:outer membrane biosynthesis protein TonB